MSHIALVKQHLQTDQEVSNVDRHDTGESTLSSRIKEQHSAIEHQQVIFLSDVHCDKLLQTTTVPPLKKQSHANLVMSCPSLSNYRNPAWDMGPL